MKCPSCGSEDVHKSFPIGCTDWVIKCDACNFNDNKIQNPNFNVQVCKDKQDSNKIHVSADIPLSNMDRWKLPHNHPDKLDSKHCGFDYAKGKNKTVRVLKDLHIDSISLVSHCPNCGSDAWEKPGRLANGDKCEHPTAIRGTHK